MIGGYRVFIKIFENKKIERKKYDDLIIFKFIVLFEKSNS